jgi:hypothetical protein
MPRKFTFTTQVYDKKTDFPATGDVDVIYIDASKNIAYRYDDSYYTISSAEVDIWGAMGSLSKGGGGGGGASWGSINGTLSNQTDLQTALDDKQNTLVSGTSIKTINSTSLLGSGNVAVQPTLTLTTTGTSGAATLSGATLNIPQYSGGGASGIHALVKPRTGQAIAPIIGGGGLASAFATANRLTAQPFIPANTFTCSNLFLNVSNFGTGSLARILIYSDLNGLPNTKLYESANLDCGTNGIKTATTSFTFTAGVTYWICTHTSLGSGFTTFTISNILGFLTNASSVFSSYIYSITFGSAPTTLSGQSASNAVFPAVFITPS